jgi:hypothetical protein
LKTSKLAVQIVKIIALFAGGLYLLGFGFFHGLNAKGAVDFLLPFEWVGCFVLGVLFLGWSGFSYVNLWKIMRK